MKSTRWKDFCAAKNGHFQRSEKETDMENDNANLIPQEAVIDADATIALWNETLITFKRRIEAAEKCLDVHQAALKAAQMANHAQQMTINEQADKIAVLAKLNDVHEGRIEALEQFVTKLTGAAPPKPN
jgi:hypothetical protein